MINKIIFLEPKTEKLHIYSKYELPRIGNILLATIMRNHGFETTACFMKREDFLQHNFECDILCLSTISTTAPSAYKIADVYRARGIPVIIGGPHVSALPNEALEHADYCIQGEGEYSLPQLIFALSEKKPVDTVPGLAWLENGQLRKNPLGPAITDLDALPFPDLNLLNTGNPKDPTKISGNTVPIQTSRGCPFDCKFCSVTAMFGKRFRNRSVESVIKEMEQYNPKKKRIFFYDDNFTADKKRAKNLLRAMIANRKKFGGTFKWSTQVRVDIAQDPELMDLMVQAGCTTVFIGFESINPEALKEMHKRQTVEDIKLAIKEIQKRKIHIHGMFIFGFDSDNPATLKETVKFAIKQHIGSAQFLLLTPLPGTEFYYEMEQAGRIFDKKWDEYDTHHVKFKPVHFEPWDLQKAQIDAHSKFYRYPNIIRKLFRGRLEAFVIGVYANHLNKRWQVIERKYLTFIRQLSRESTQLSKSIVQAEVPSN